MEILNNFVSICCFSTVAVVIGAVFMLPIIIIAAIYKVVKKPRNKVHFYVIRMPSGILNLYLFKPNKQLIGSEFAAVQNLDCLYITSEDNFLKYNLNPKDFKDLKCEDEPVEVFINLEN